MYRRNLVSYTIVNGKICDKRKYCNMDDLPTKCPHCGHELTKPYDGTSQGITHHTSVHIVRIVKDFIHYILMK